MDNGTKEIIALLGSGHGRDVRQLRPGVWELNSPAWPWGQRVRHHEGLRHRIISTVLSMPQPSYLLYSENPNEELHTSWPEIGKNLWLIVPNTVTAEQLCEFWYLGGWTLFVGNVTNPEGWLIKQRHYPEGIEDDLRENDLAVIVTGYLDDDPWWVALDENAAQRAHDLDKAVSRYAKGTEIGTV